MHRNHRGCSSSGTGSQNSNFTKHLSEFTGETVTIFTTSGGASGFGFTGVILTVYPDFVRLVTEPGMTPISPLTDNVFGDRDSGGRISGGIGRISNLGRAADNSPSKVGSVVDIPINRIAAFTHNST